jgi:dienelactone hydrolase
VADPAKLLYRDPSYDGQLARTVSAALVHGADIGEAMATARRVGRRSGGAWYDAWSKTAATAEAVGEQARLAGDRVTAQRSFLRASEYYRQAYYFLRSNLDDPRLKAAYASHVNTFRAATELMDHGAEAVRIRYEATTLSGYLFTPDRSGAKRPTLVFPCGYDSTAEAGWVNVPDALDRGYNVLSVEGPGQGEALFTQRLFFRADYEAVLSPVLDWLLARPEVDGSRVALVGRSFGGYLAPRAAAFEHRVVALVCDPAQPEMAARLPDGLVGKVAAPVVKAQMRINPNRAEFFGARMAAHGIDSIEAYFAELHRFTMLEHAGQITCPTLIVEAEHDFAGGSGALLQGAMTAPVELVTLTEAQGADGHCAGLGQEIWAGVVYGWLERTLNNVAAAETSG